MFENLAEAKHSWIIHVLYHLGLRVYERDRFPGRSARLERWAAVWGDSLEPGLIDTVETAITEIEEREGLRLEYVPEERLNAYLRELDAMAASRREPPPPDYDPVAAQKRIEQFRREYLAA